MAEVSGKRHFYTWEVPGKPVAVRLDVNVIERLRSAVIQGAKSIPGRGLETGGLLLGQTRRQAGGILVEIEDFEPIECEHVVGPSYLLSPVDRKVLEERIAWRKSGAGRLPAVGFYRGHTRKDFAIAVEDADLLSWYFGRASDVFLLVKPNDNGPATAGFVIWERGKIRSPKPYLEFPFDAAALMAMGRAAGAEAVELSPGRAKATARSMRIPSPLTLLRSIPRPPLSWTWAGIALLLATGFVTTIRHGDTKPGPPAAPLSLRVTPDAGALHLQWDRQSSTIKTARRAVLWIDDGGAKRKLNLDATHLSSGSIAYWPKSEDVTFRLEVATPTSSASESFRAIGAPQVAAVPAAEPETARAEAAAATVEPAPAPIIEPVAAPVIRAASPSVNHRRGWADRRSIFRRAIRRFTPPPISIAAVLAPAEPAPPDVVPLVAYAGDAAPPVDLVAEPRRPEIPNPILSIAVEPVSNSPTGLRSVEYALLGRRKENDFVPPAPMRQSQPEVPAEMRARLTRAVPVNVKVYVNPSGRVDYAEVLSNGTGANRDWASLALFSARRWEFVPARQDGRDVAGEVILRYRFAPQRP